jgi:hypothetical protein
MELDIFSGEISILPKDKIGPKVSEDENISIAKPSSPA